MSSIVFFFPRKHIGGVQTLFLRLANDISKYEKVSVVDYKNGYLARNKSDRVKLIEFEDDKEIKIENDSVLIFQADCIFKSYRVCKSNNTKVFFWNVHPENLQGGFLRESKFLYNTRLIKKVKSILNEPSQKLLSLVLEKNAIYHMDGANISSTRKISGTNVTLPMLPLYFKDRNKNTYLKSDISKVMNVVWLGRLELGFKTIPLIQVLKDLNKLSSRLKIKCTIIGEGNGKSAIQEVTSDLTNIETNFLGTLEGENLQRQLLKNDMAFAMGTSALHTGGLGIPTVLLDCSFTGMPQEYRYRWLFETLDYSLGYVVTPNQSSIPKENTHTMDDMINQLNNNPNDYSLSTKEYVEVEYSMEVKKYIETFKSTNLLLSDFLECYKKYKFKSIIYISRSLHTKASNIRLFRVIWKSIKYRTLKIDDF